MRQVLYCPYCGKKIELGREFSDLRDTQELSLDELNTLMPKAHRSDAPPPPLRPGEETMPDNGWLRKHLNRQRRIQTRFMLLLVAVLLVFMVTYLLARIR